MIIKIKDILSSHDSSCYPNTEHISVIFLILMELL